MVCLSVFRQGDWCGSGWDVERARLWSLLSKDRVLRVVTRLRIWTRFVRFRIGRAWHIVFPPQWREHVFGHNCMCDPFFFKTWFRWQFNIWVYNWWYIVGGKGWGFCVLVRVLKCLAVMVFVITTTFATAWNPIGALLHLYQSAAIYFSCQGRGGKVSPGVRGKILFIEMLRI